MGFDLTAKKKGVEGFYCGAFFWPWMLGQGVGLPIGYGDAFAPGSFTYRPDAKGLSPGYNDGFKVSARESKMMAECARGLARVLRFRQKQWDELPEEERKRIDANRKLYDYMNFPVRSDWVNQLDKFVDFAVASGGFKIC